MSLQLQICLKNTSTAQISLLYTDGCLHPRSNIYAQRNLIVKGLNIWNAHVLLTTSWQGDSAGRWRPRDAVTHTWPSLSWSSSACGCKQVQTTPVTLSSEMKPGVPSAKTSVGAGTEQKQAQILLWASISAAKWLLLKWKVPCHSSPPHWPKTQLPLPRVQFPPLEDWGPAANPRAQWPKKPVMTISLSYWFASLSLQFLCSSAPACFCPQL